MSSFKEDHCLMKHRPYVHSTLDHHYMVFIYLFQFFYFILLIEKERVSDFLAFDLCVWKTEFYTNFFLVKEFYTLFSQRKPTVIH